MSEKIFKILKGIHNYAKGGGGDYLRNDRISLPFNAKIEKDELKDL